MSLPVLTANSPSAGYIAWTSFSISYGGVQRTIIAGNTNKIFTYWLWNAGNPATTLTTADVLPTLSDDDLLLFVNRGGIPIAVQNANIIEGSLIVSGSIVGTSIAANTIDANKLLADTITAREIQSGAVTARELSISSVGGVAAVNGDMDDIDPATFVPAGWTAGFERSGTLPTYAAETVTPLSGTSSVKVTLAANSVEGMAARATPVKSGEKIMFATAFRTSVTGVPITLRAYFGTTENFTAVQKIATVPALAENVYIYDVSPTGLVARNDLPTPLVGPGISAVLDGWLTPVTTTLYVTGQITVPNGARFVRFMLASGLTAASPAHVATWDALEYALVVTSVRMADGAITARTLSADAITGKTITGGTINGTAINGAVITGPQIQTAASGKRVMVGDPNNINSVRFYSGGANQRTGGLIEAGDDGYGPTLFIWPGDNFNFVDGEVIIDGSLKILGPPLPATSGGTGTTQHGVVGGPVVGPASTQDCGNVFKTVLTVTAPVIAGKMYKITGFVNGSQITAAGLTRAQIVDDQGGQQWIFYTNSMAVGVVGLGTSVLFMTASSTRTASFYIQGISSAGAYRVSANLSRLTVEAC